MNRLITTAYTYDNLNRVKTETWLGDGKQFTYTYDQNSNLTSADDGTRHYDDIRSIALRSSPILTHASDRYLD